MTSPKIVCRSIRPRTPSCGHIERPAGSEWWRRWGGSGHRACLTFRPASKRATPNWKWTAMSACSEARPCRQNCASASAPTWSRSRRTRASTTRSMQLHRRRVAAGQRSSPPRSSASARKSPPLRRRSAFSRRDNGERQPRRLSRSLRQSLLLEHGDHGRGSAQPQLLPPGDHLVVSVLRQPGTLGEGLDEAIVHAGIDQAFRYAGSDVWRVQAGIKRRARGFPQDIDRLRWARARRHCPQHLTYIARIDIVIDHDHVFSEIRPGRALRSERHYLRGMAGIHLLDRNHGNTPTRRLGNRPHALDPWHAEFLQVGPDDGRAQRRPEQAALIGRSVGHQGASQGRIVSVTNTLDSHERRRPARPPVIAGKLAERSFGKGLVRIEKTFEDDLGSRRQRQAGELAGEHLDWCAVDAGIIFVFGLGFRQAGRGDQEKQRIYAIGGPDRHRLAPSPPFLPIPTLLPAPPRIHPHLPPTLD